METETVVFKKKSRRNFRKKNLEDEEEDSVEGEKTVSEQKPEEKPKTSSKSAPKTLLSFDHGEEESGDVFKVKKSKESRRLSKQRVKTKKTKENEAEDTVSSSVTDQGLVNDEKLESLREELSNLGGEDDGDDGVENQAEKVVESDGIIFKPLRANPNKGSSFQIPDAAAIHAARKRREMARQMVSEFVPIDDTERYSGKFETIDKSRLIREDDNDHSDEDPDTPLGFGTRKTNHPGMQRRMEVEKALAKELSDEDEKSEEEDDALRRFEEEQIRKGVSIPQAQQEEDNTYQMYLTQQYLYGSKDIDPSYSQYNEQGIAKPDYLSYPPTSLNSVTIDMVWEKMNNRIISLQEVNRSRRLEKEKISSQIESCNASATSLEKQMKDAEGRYGFFQEMRGYVKDLIECLNEKVRQ
jgi:GC-rich sequence DNA-binding factor